MSDIIIIGGGCSGVIAAIFAKNKNNKVTIIERNNTLLKKLLLTGNGRCNYLNESYSINDYHSEDIDKVNEILTTNNIEKVKEFFTKLGIIPKIKNGYYYPFSNQATTIKNALLKELKDKNIEVVLNSYVENIKKEKKKFIIKTNDKEYTADKLIISAGSYAYPKTGSDGSFYKILENFKHTIIKPLPALVPLISDFKYLKDWDGVRSDVILKLEEDSVVVKEESGEVQLTKYGISGICTFQLSHLVTRGLYNNKKEVMLINFVPFIKNYVTIWMNDYSNKHKNKNVYELLSGFLNEKIVNVILKVTKIDKNKYYYELSKEEKFTLCKNLYSFKINIIDTMGFDYSQTCNGGVKLTEINTKTMESKKKKNLYITGELLDMNGNCGGYNLTECWISGMLAGMDCGKND